MVERHVTDPVRIAQLLASEVQGRTGGALGSVDVVDADPDAAPETGGALAYRLAGPDGAAGTVSIHPDAVILVIGSADAGLAEPAIQAGATAASGIDRESLSVVREGDCLNLEIRTGAAVKPAIDVLRAVVST